MFDPAYYQAQNPGLTAASLANAGFTDGYDHYLKHGAAEGRLAHPFFDPATYIASLGAEAAADCVKTGAFQHFLSQDWGAAPEPQVSPHFDPAWYRATYKDIAEHIPHSWHSALHHYLAHGRDAGLSPLPRIKIHIDRPAHRNGEALEPIAGHLDIIGWAAANHPVVSVDVMIGDEHCGRAHHGIRTEGVAAAFPDLTHALFAGFRFVGPSPPAPGRRRLRIVARGETGLEACESVEVTFAPATEAEGPWSLRRRMRASEASMKHRLLQRAGLAPTFCIVLRDTPDADARTRTVASLHRQVYANWHLHGEASTPGDWIVPLTPGDELGVDALLELALHRRADPDADYIYSDERRIDPWTGTVAPFFKPDWSPDLLLSFNYIGRLWAASPDLAARAGLTPTALAQSGEWDAARRLTAAARRIAHLPLVLCESATPPEPEARPALPAHAGDDPLVSVIIPTAGTGHLIDACLHLLRTGTDYPHVQIIIVSTVPGPAPWKDGALVIEDPGPFNWSRANNRGAAAAAGELLLCLNDDIEGSDPSWLRTLVEVIGRPGVGAVGPRLLYPSGTVQHAGIFLDGKLGRHAFAGCAPDAPGPFGLALTQRNVSAVTGACLLTRRDVFDQLGGFDERLDIACNDVDFCLRCLDAGLLVTYTPHATLTHHESATRTGLTAREAANEALFANLWRTRLSRGDPYFSPHLSLTHTDMRPEPEFVETIYPARPLAAPESVRRILVIKLDHIGDFILALPAIRRLRAAFAHARLTLLASPAVCDLARLEPAIDETIAFEFFHARSALGLRDLAPSDLDDLSQALQAKQLDLAIDLRCHEETRPILQTCGATWRAGFDAAFSCPWLDIVAVMEPDVQGGAKRTHAADTLLDFANKIAASFTVSWQRPTVPRSFVWPAGLPTPPEGVRWRIAIHPGAGNATKQWPPAYFGELIDLLIEAFDCWIILVGSKDEGDIGATILSRRRRDGRVAAAIGLTDPPQLAGLIAACDLFIGNDSGPHHLAACLDIPTIGIRSGVVDAHEWGALGPFTAAVRKRVVCSPCYLATPADCPRALACLTGLTTQSVLRSARIMLSSKS